MDDYFDEELDDQWSDDDDQSGVDPFEQLTRSEQDLFFRVLDLLPDEKRPDAIEYFMDHPKKIRAIVDNVKQKKELIKNKDVAGLKEVFQQEQVLLEHIASSSEEGQTEE